MSSRAREIVRKGICKHAGAWSFIENDQHLIASIDTAADDAITALHAANLRIVDAGDLAEMLSAMDYVSEYLQQKWGYDGIRERVNAALNMEDPDGN
jgi:hypothetical protein